jgi:hypothetical protein
MAVVLSIIIILAGSYFSYQWNIKKREIRIFTQQVEEIGSEGGFVRPLSPPMIESGNPLHGIPIFI